MAMTYTFYVQGREVPLSETYAFLVLAEARAQELSEQYGRTVSVYNAHGLRVYKITVAA